MNLNQLYKKYRRRKLMKRLKLYTNLAKDTFYGNGFDVDLRHPELGHTYLTIGSHCMIEGKFIFETNTGKILVGNRCHIGNSSFITRSKITIGDDVTIAWGCTIYDHNSHSVNWKERRVDTEQEYLDIMECGDSIRNKDWSCVATKPIVIEDKVWIGFGVTILKGVMIGEGAVVGAGSVVTKDVEPWTVVGGNPAHIVKRLKSGEGK